MCLFGMDTEVELNEMTKCSKNGEQENEIEDEIRKDDKKQKKWQTFQQFFSELIGTWLMVLIGTSAVAAAVLTGGQYGIFIKKIHNLEI